MSVTTFRARRQITLPLEVVRAAGLRPGDREEWRFEDGEIRGRKLVPDSAFMSGKRAVDLFRSHEASALDHWAADEIEAQIRKLDAETDHSPDL